MKTKQPKYYFELTPEQVEKIRPALEEVIRSNYACAAGSVVAQIMEVDETVVVIVRYLDHDTTLRVQNAIGEIKSGKMSTPAYLDKSLQRARNA